jgi:hypothetical protein
MTRYIKVEYNDGKIKYYEENKYKDVFDFEKLAQNLITLSSVISVELITVYKKTY